MYLNVTDVPLLDATDVSQGRRQEAFTLQTLKAFADNRTGFPAKAEPAISVIHSRSKGAQVHEDFRHPLRSLEGIVLWDHIPASMLSCPGTNVSIASGHRGCARPDSRRWKRRTVWCLRSSDLLNAWAEKRAYRVVGTGHSTNTAALDLLSNFVATTPSCGCNAHCGSN